MDYEGQVCPLCQQRVHYTQINIGKDAGVEKVVIRTCGCKPKIIELPITMKE